MERRTFIASLSALTLLPGAAFAAGFRDYKTGLVKRRLARGDTVFLDFSATWCSTCRTQERVIGALMQENPDYDKEIFFVRVDWDQFRGAKITKDLKIPRRSTLVVLKGNQELGRIVAGTSREVIKELMDTALTAAMA